MNEEDKVRKGFYGDLDRNQVDIDLPKFVEIMDENYKLKQELKDIRDEKGLNNPYKKLIDFAKMTDAWRPIPRAFMAVYMILLYQSVSWFMTIPDPNNAQSALISVVVGAGAAWFASYVRSNGEGGGESS